MTEPSVCYRHPAVESYVLCQRCSRPICPSCQREAAVGVQCPECVAAGAPAPTRSSFGARVRGGRPIATLTLIVVTVLVYLGQLSPLHLGGLPVTQALAFYEPLSGPEPWRWLTYSLVHSDGGGFGVLHIALNMYALYLVGPYLEHQFGRLRFLALWLLSVLGGAVAYAALTQDALMVGASGGVFGLFGAWFVVHRRLGRDASQVAGIIVINVLLGFFISGIAWQGHLGGLAAGLAGAAVLAYAPASKRALVQGLGLAGLALVLLVAAVLLSPPVLTGPF